MTPQTTADQHHTLAEQIFTDVLNDQNLDALSEYYADDCQFYGMGGPEAIDRDAYAEFLAIHFEAFPDLTFDLLETVTEGDTIAVRWTSTGTHENDLMDVPATGKTATVTGMSILHIEDGKAVEVYSEQDMLRLLTQIDAIPDSPRKIVRLLAGQLKSRLGRQ